MGSRVVCGNVYGAEDFKAGACGLHQVEVDEIGVFAANGCCISSATLESITCHGRAEGPSSPGSSHSVDQFERMKAERTTFADSYREFRRRFPEGKAGISARYFKGLRERGAGRKVDL
jgi:hypothetical protein